MSEVTEVLKVYPEGRVLKLADGSIRVEGIYDDDAAPMTGRAVFLGSPPPKSRPLPPHGFTLRGRRIVAVRELQPWERPPAPEPDRRAEESEQARARASMIGLLAGERACLVSSPPV